VKIIVQKSDLREIAPLFRVDAVESDLQPRYNVAPRQPMAVIMEEGKKKIVTMQWGLIPFWAKDPAIANWLINARAETVAEKPSFRNPFKSKRCLIIANLKKYPAILIFPCCASHFRWISDSMQPPAP
jgi:putative SOS response-associated peptidase YedK